MFDFILNAYRQNKMPHAFLFVGRGVEKGGLIEKIAALLLCASPQSEGACGVCHACQWFLQGVHPDHCILGENGQTILVDHLRDLHGFLEKTPHQNNFKVITIHEVEALSIYTANAVLKNLEEPAERTVFLLTAQNIQKVLPTIRSRCILIHLHDRPIEFSNTDQNIKEILFWGTGSLFNQEEIFQKIINETLETLYLFYYWVAEYCRYGSTKNTGYLSLISEQARVDAFLEILPIEKAMVFLDSLVEAIESLNVVGLNKELLWGSLMLQWQQLKERKG